MPEPADLRVLGGVLRSFREREGLSQEALADEAGIHRAYVGGVERGERNASFRSLARIFAALGISWSVFGRELDRRSRARPRR